MLIIISGTSSSGKSTVCQELQKKLGDGWLNFSTDGYLGMLGETNNPLSICDSILKKIPHS